MEDLTISVVFADLVSLDRGIYLVFFLARVRMLVLN